MAINPVQDSISSSVTSRPAQYAGTPAPAPVASADSVSFSGNESSGAYNLRSASVGLAQLGSLLQVASSGTQHISAVLGQLQQLAQQAQSGSDSESALAQLNGEFQQLLSGLDQIVSDTSFSGSGLLDGSLGFGSVDNSALSAALEASGQDTSAFTPVIPALTAQSLFGNIPDISTPQSAASAYNAIAVAQATVSDTAGSIDSAQAQVNFAAANVDSALANSDASSATLSDSDFGNVADIFTGILSTPDASASAQTGNLPSGLLGLLQE